jgi:hypothetical protein
MVNENLAIVFSQSPFALQPLLLRAIISETLRTYEGMTYPLGMQGVS